MDNDNDRNSDVRAGVCLSICLSVCLQSGGMAEMWMGQRGVSFWRGTSFDALTVGIDSSWSRYFCSCFRRSKTNLGSIFPKICNPQLYWP